MPSVVGMSYKNKKEVSSVYSEYILTSNSPFIITAWQKDWNLLEKLHSVPPCHGTPVQTEKLAKNRPLVKELP